MTIDTSEMHKYLAKPIPFVANAASRISFNEVQSMNQLFKNKMLNCKNPLTGQDVPCSDMASGFFEKSALQKIVNQISPGTDTIAAVRFFFGYDETLDRNKIRIIMMGATNSGNLLYVNSHTGTYMYANSIERSWP
jgi:hypothetical protein